MTPLEIEHSKCRITVHYQLSYSAYQWKWPGLDAGLQFMASRVKDKIRVGVRVSAFYF